MPRQDNPIPFFIADAVAEGYTCFNCGKIVYYKKENCPEPVNKEKQKLEREKFTLKKGRPQQSAKFNNREKEIPRK